MTDINVVSAHIPTAFLRRTNRLKIDERIEPITDGKTIIIP